jgi:hypothetical protein
MKRTFTLSFDCDNSAFELRPAAEVCRLLRATAKRIENGVTDGKIMDSNGNSVGRFELATRFATRSAS